MTVLVVDDLAINRKLLRTTLEAEGHAIFEALDGLDALKVLDRAEVDAIISDILMPNMDGYRLCCEVRKNRRLCGLPFIFYSSTYTSAADEKLCGELGGDRFIRKPAPTDVILDALRETMEAAKGRAASQIGPARELEIMREYSERLIVKLEERNEELSRHSDLMRQSEETLRRLSGRLLRLQDEERRRIARELHDTTAQKLAALSMNLSMLETRASYQKDPKGRKIIEESQSLAAACGHELRTLSYLLHPPLLDELGLEGAVRDYAEGFARRSGLQIAVEIRPDVGRLPNDAEVTLFRILQECLTNIHRHSGSSTASIRLFRQETEVRLEVQDAGRGMPSKPAALAAGPAPQLGVGITGMRERLRQFGGRLEIVSEARGTTVAATLPVERCGT